MSLCVPPAESDHTLIDFLAHHRHISRRKAKDIINRRCVFVNGQRIWMAHHRLQPGDTVDITEESGVEPRMDASLILFQDHDYLVVNKPAGIVTNGPHSLEAALQARLANPALTAVHRLDRNTSGCLLLAQHREAQRRIISSFSGRKIKKIYHAIVIGMITEKELSITKAIEGQPAITHIRVLDTNRQASHLLIAIETGRTHQIRKHLTAFRHPIAGDQYYATRRDISPAERSIQRHMLHAFRLSFIHPITGDAIRCTAPLPDDFQNCLHRFHLR